MTNETRNNIISLFGGEANIDWETIKNEYRGMSEEEILEALNQMWPQDDNAQLAADIYSELNQL